LKSLIIKFQSNGKDQLIHSDFKDLENITYDRLIKIVSNSKDLTYVILAETIDSKLVLVVETYGFTKILSKTTKEIVHEIKNILSIISASSLIIRKILRKPDLLERIDTCEKMTIDIEESVTRVIKVLDKLKNEGNNEFKNNEYYPRIRDVVNFIESKLDSLLTSGHIELNINKSEINDPSKHFVIKDMFVDQVILNLIKNSIYSLVKGKTLKPKIEITLKQTEEYFIFKINDNGPGFDLSQKDKLFQDGYSTKGKEGSGVGLSLCKKNIQLSGGEISIDFDYKEGASIEFSLPIKKS